MKPSFRTPEPSATNTFARDQNASLIARTFAALQNGRRPRNGRSSLKSALGATRFSVPSKRLNNAAGRSLLHNCSAPSWLTLKQQQDGDLRSQSEKARFRTRAKAPGVLTPEPIQEEEEELAPLPGVPVNGASVVSLSPPPATDSGNGSFKGRSLGADAEKVAESGIGITSFLKDKNILITGSTGFLAKVLVEKILREQPLVGRLFLVIQPKADASAERRLQTQVIGSQIFEQLRGAHGEEYAQFMREKMCAVEGDVSKDGLGLDEATTREVMQQVDVIINSAATTTFDERYDVALNINTLGPKRLMEFARSCPNLKVLVHVSTAYVNGTREGWTEERPFVDGDSITKELRGPQACPDLSVDGELALAERELERVRGQVAAGRGADGNQVDPAAEEEKHMVALGMSRALMFGWQDTYVLSKAMGEMLVSRHLWGSHFPVVVLRPSIVESTAHEPVPGWMEGLRMCDPIVLAYGKGHLSGFVGDPEGVLDTVPADYVINALLAAMVHNAKQPPGSLAVYHVATSVARPLVIQQFVDSVSDHFEHFPMMLARGGGPVRGPRMKAFRHPWLFQLDLLWKYQLPLQLAQLGAKLRGKRPDKRTSLLLKTAQQLAYFAKIYAPYTYYSCRFDASNTLGLLELMSEEERQHYDFDLSRIDWHDYLCNVHLPGLRKYVLKGRGSS